MKNEKNQPFDSFEEITHQKQRAEVKLEEAKTLQVIEASQNQEIANYIDARDLANQLHGKVAVFAGINDLFRAAFLKNLREVRDNKLYKHITIIDEHGKSSLCGTFKNYCKYGLKRSYSTVHEELQNEELLNIAHDPLKDMGILRDQFRSLHKADNSLLEEVKQAAVNNDKDKVLEIIDDLSSRHVREKEKLTKEKESLQEQIDSARAKDGANQRFLQAKEDKINDLERVVSKSLTPDEEKQRHQQTEADLKKELESVVTSCALSIDRLNVIIEKVFMYDKGTEELRSQPGSQYEYLMRHLVNTSLDNQLYFDAKNIFAPLMEMFELVEPDLPIE